MAQLLFAKNQINVKIAYCGPAGSGKATCLAALRGEVAGAGEVHPQEFEGEQAAILDCFPAWIEPIRERTVSLQLFASSVPHRLLLQGADALVFVADSGALDANQAAWRALGEALEADGQSLAELPVVFQWNKRDLKDAVAVADLEGALNPGGAPACESVATVGTGVLEALKRASELAVQGLENLED